MPIVNGPDLKPELVQGIEKQSTLNFATTNEVIELPSVEGKQTQIIGMNWATSASTTLTVRDKANTARVMTFNLSANSGPYGFTKFAADIIEFQSSAVLSGLHVLYKHV